MRAVAVIPARYGSTRFPGKPLARDTGKYLIQHVCERVAAARSIERCIVATDDERIATAVASFGGEAVLTRPDHVSGTDRIAEVVAGLPGAGDDVIVNVQGDEPEIAPGALDQLVGRLAQDAGAPMATLACPFSEESDPADPNCVKVVVDSRGYALYFSRALIPYERDEATAGVKSGYFPRLHVGVYGYRRGFLLDLAGWPPGRLEQVERLEQLRVLERGVPIAVEEISAGPAGVDTPADYARFVARERLSV